jgi:hypothetical protein
LNYLGRTNRAKGLADEVGSLRMRRYFETEAEEEPTIDTLFQLANGQPAARREWLRLEQESFLLSALLHDIVLSDIISRIGAVQFAPAENENVEVEIVAKLEVPAARSPRRADQPGAAQSAVP